MKLDHVLCLQISDITFGSFLGHITLYAAFGFLQWYESENSDKPCITSADASQHSALVDVMKGEGHL